MAHVIWMWLMALDLMGWLRLLGIAIWGAVAVARAGAVRRVLAGHARHFDFIWALIGAFGAMVFGYNLRWFVASESLAFYVGLHVFSIGLALLSFRVVRAYEASRHE